MNEEREHSRVGRRSKVLCGAQGWPAGGRVDAGAQKHATSVRK